MDVPKTVDLNISYHILLIKLNSQKKDITCLLERCRNFPTVNVYLTVNVIRTPFIVYQKRMFAVTLYSFELKIINKQKCVSYNNILMRIIKIKRNK